MQRSLFLLFALSMCLPLPRLAYASDGDTKPEIEALLQTQYQGKVLQLRNWYVEGDQAYSADGKIEGQAEEGAWIRYGIIAIEKIGLGDGHVDLRGRRILVIQQKFSKEEQLQSPDATGTHPVLARTNDRVSIRINLAAQQPTFGGVNQAIAHVFANRQEIVPRIPISLREHYARLMSGDWSHYVKPLIKETERDGEEPFETTPDGLSIYRASGPDQKTNTRVTAPAVLQQVDPEYIEKDRQAKIQGTIVMQIIIDREGKPRDIQLVSGLTQELEASAIAAVRQWKFRPAMREGHPVATLANVEVNFHPY